MGRIKKVKIEEIVASRDLLVAQEYINEKTSYYSEFNKVYEEFCSLNEKEDLTSEEVTLKIEAGKKVASIITLDFDFNKEEVKSKSTEYIKLARDILYVAGSKPFNDSEALILLVRALYGQTNIAYSQTGEHKIVNIEDGNEWVDHLERDTKDHTLKSYALTLRVFQYMVNGEALGLSVEQRLKKSETDLIYASKWDEENYLAFYALGLLYSDNGNSKYNVEKATTNFKKVLEFKDKETKLDEYLMNGEKERAMENASKKIDSLSQK